MLLKSNKQPWIWRCFFLGESSNISISPLVLLCAIAVSRCFLMSLIDSLGKERMTKYDSVGLPLLSDEIFFPALIHGFLKGRVIFQSGICAFGKFGSLCFVGVVGALVPVHVSQHHYQEANQDKSHSCNDTYGEEETFECSLSLMISNS